MTDRDEVERFNPPFMFSTQKHGRMHAEADGQWVRLSDYEALRQRAEAAEADAASEKEVSQANFNDLFVARKELTEARAQIAAAWEEGRNAAAEFACQWHKDEQPDLRDDIRVLTPPADASAALTARLDAEWNAAMGKAAQACYAACSETRHVTLGFKVEKSICALKRGARTLPPHDLAQKGEIE